MMKTITITTLVSVLIILSSCGGNQTSNKSQSLSEPPNIDLHAAVLMGDLDAVKGHILGESDINIIEPAGGSTPLITAAVFGKTEIAKELINAGADVNIINNDGATALHSAAFLCRIEIVKMLIANGADTSIRNHFGSTALESVLAPFENVKPIYEQFAKDLGVLGLKLDFNRIETTRPLIVKLLK